MATKRELIAALTRSVAKLDENLKLPVVNIFDTLTPILRQIAALVHTIDPFQLLTLWPVCKETACWSTAVRWAAVNV